MPRPKSKIPDRWIPYNACGDVIEGTRIICFKVPLPKSVQEREPGLTKIWDIPAVLAEIPKLGAVIDLTNTARYYNPREFEMKNVIHRKMLMPGREIPPESKVREFMDAVDECLGKNSELLVGVHCTHGLNRTGYMVCRYMRDRMNIPAQEAINRFEKARGYKIERENYLASLLNKKIPPPEFGKGTIIKQINGQHDVSNVESTEYEYDSRYSNNGYGQNRGRHESNNGYRNDQYSINDGSNWYEHSTNGIWGNRSESGSYGQYSNYSTKYNSNGRNNKYQHSSDRYLSWRNGSEGSSYGQNSTHYNSNGRNNRYPHSSNSNGYLPWGNRSEGSSYNGQTSIDFHNHNGGYSGRNGNRSTSGWSGNRYDY